MAGLLDGIEQQLSERAPDKQFGPPTGAAPDWYDQYDSKVWRFDRMVTAAEAAPTSPLQCIVESQARNIQWLVVPPPGVTDYDLVVGRWVQLPVTPRSKGHQVSMWVVEQTLSGLGTAATFVEQKNERDPVLCYVSAVTGAPGGPVAGITKPNNPSGLLDGFAVLHRPAAPI
jgi:hypothetical protein